MKIIEAIQQLEQIMRKEGEELELYMEIGENVSCKQCGETKYRMKDGWCLVIFSVCWFFVPNIATFSAGIF